MNTDLAARTVLAARSPVPAACEVWVDARRWAALNEQRLTSPAFEAALPWTVESARRPAMRRRSGLRRVA
jgi:hypothetical protein